MTAAPAFNAGTLQERIGVVRPITPAECHELARPDPGIPPPSEGPLRFGRMNRGHWAFRQLAHPGREDQAVALWVPDGVNVLRGLIVELHRASVVGRSDYQAVARALGFGIFGALVQWTNFDRVLPDQLEKLATAMARPELSNVPWAIVAGSRNVAASCAFALQDAVPDRVLCLLTHGGPGIAFDIDDRRAVARFGGIPIISVNGTDDEYVGGGRWYTREYRAIRKVGLPWCAAPDWGGGHTGFTNGTMFWPFLAAVIRARYPRQADPRRGRVRLQALTARAGILVDRPAVWCPDSSVAAVWRAYARKVPAGRLSVQPGALSGPSILRITGLPRWRGYRAEFFDGDQLIGTSDSQPFQLRSSGLKRGLHTVYAVIQGPAGQQGLTRPVVVADGQTVNQRLGMRAASRFDQHLESFQ